MQLLYWEMKHWIGHHAMCVLILLQKQQRDYNNYTAVWAVTSHSIISHTYSSSWYCIYTNTANINQRFVGLVLSVHPNEMGMNSLFLSNTLVANYNYNLSYSGRNMNSKLVVYQSTHFLHCSYLLLSTCVQDDCTDGKDYTHVYTYNYTCMHTKMILECTQILNFGIK